MKTADLIGPALDWAVARAELIEDRFIVSNDWGVYWIDEDGVNYEYKPSKDWAEGGPIIEREGMQLWKGAEWNAAYGNSINPSDDEIFSGPTPLVAAMRCYVSKQLGHEVNIPEEIAA